MANDFREFTFEHEGRTYQVRAAKLLEAWHIKVFLNEIAVSDSYEVSTEVIHDAKVTGVSEDAVGDMMKIAEDDVRRGVVPGNR